MKSGLPMNQRRISMPDALRAGLLLAMASLLLACSDTRQVEPAGASTQWADMDSLQIEQAWARATPPSAKVGAGYLRIRNRSDRPARLIGAQAERASSVEIHNMSMQDGMMRMRRIEQVDIPAQGVAELAPGGDHLMLFGLKAPLQAGESLPLTLQFANGGELSLNLAVRKDAPQ